MRVEQQVTFRWELNAEEDAVVCAALGLYATQDQRAATLLDARRGSPVTLDNLQPMIVGVGGNPFVKPRPLPDVDLLADEILEERR